ncbi:MAG: purD [Firmicutes bacterium]|nr:purD [Bacillota bacterium]
MRILVIGGGGREHALVWKLKMSSRVDQIYCIPGNPGIAELAECVSLDMSDNEKLAQFALAQQIDLTVVGPEMPLTNGVVDCFKKYNLKIFGPSQAAAQLEGSKEFAKKLMRKYRVPTGDFVVFTEYEAARQYVLSHEAPLVIKADGLAAGKGVVVAMSREEALTALEDMMCSQVFGSAGNKVVIEEFLSGEEASLLVFTDGYTAVPMVAAQDHKRALDGDMGPNTGGMGTYAPAPVITPAIKDQVMKEIVQPVVDGMRTEGCTYCGCLYAGLMITADGPKVIEFNARFGDPETQVVLPLLKSDLAVVMEACVDQKLDTVAVEWEDQAAVCVVLAAGGYPGSYDKGAVIEGLAEAKDAGATVFHAGTAFNAEGSIVTNGGRVLGVTVAAIDLSAAIEKVYDAVKCIHFTGMQYRKDIAHRALNR